MAHYYYLGKLNVTLCLDLCDDFVTKLKCNFVLLVIGEIASYYQWVILQVQ